MTLFYLVKTKLKYEIRAFMFEFRFKLKKGTIKCLLPISLEHPK